MKLALFDFDGTITSKDSLPDFIQFAVGKPRYYLGLFKLSPMLLSYKLKLLSNHTAKSRLIGYFFGGWPTEKFQRVGDRYASTQIDKIVRPDALKKILWHQAHGHQVVIVSASIDAWLKKWCERLSIELIATGLESRNDKINGRFSPPNCHGAEKLNRINQQYDLSAYDYIYAYGDSDGDKQMLAIAQAPHYKYFKQQPDQPAT